MELGRERARAARRATGPAWPSGPPRVFPGLVPQSTPDWASTALHWSGSETVAEAIAAVLPPDDEGVGRNESVRTRRPSGGHRAGWQARAGRFMSGRAHQPAFEQGVGAGRAGHTTPRGLDRILQAKHGALVIIGDDPEVLSICTGGFLLDAEFSPQRLSELAKMDGAIILAADRLAHRAGQRAPDAQVLHPDHRDRYRHRTAERVARSLDVPVITVSEAMATIAVYRQDRKHTTQSSSWLIDRASPGPFHPAAFQVSVR